MDIGYVAAVAGGVLALLSPCSALLLPSFFAYAFQRPGRVAARTGLFYLGLLTTLVPLGIGSSLVTRIMVNHRDAVINVAGITLIVLGVAQALGSGFAPRFATAALGRLEVDGPVSVVALGAVYGLAGFCSGPVLGSVLTIAASSGRPFYAGTLLAAYALGMALPLFLLAVTWDRWQVARQRWLRRRTLRFLGREVNLVGLVSGLLFVVVGVVFIRYEGTAGPFSFRAADTEASAQRWLQDHLTGNVDVIVLVVVMLAGGVLAIRRARPH